MGISSRELYSHYYLNIQNKNKDYLLLILGNSRQHWTLKLHGCSFFNILFFLAQTLANSVGISYTGSLSLWLSFLSHFWYSPPAQPFLRLAVGERNFAHVKQFPDFFVLKPASISTLPTHVSRHSKNNKRKNLLSVTPLKPLTAQTVGFCWQNFTSFVSLEESGY